MLNFMGPFMGHKDSKIPIDYIEGAMIASWALEACGWWGIHLMVSTVVSHYSK